MPPIDEITNAAPITPVADAVSSNEPAQASEDKNLGDIYDRLTASPSERDEGGRFKAKDSAAQSADEAGSDQPGPEDAGDQPLASERQVQPVALPANWPREKADAWNAIPETARGPVQEVLQGLHAKMSDQGRQIAGYKDIDSIVADMKQSYPDKFSGEQAISPAQAINFLYGMQKAFDADPMAALMKVAENYDLMPHLVKRFAQAGQGDPAVTTSQTPAPDLSQVLKQIEERVLSKLSPEKLEQQITQVMSKSETRQAIDRFSQEKPLWADVEETLPAFINIARAQQPEAPPLAVLEAAYDMAVHANPATRAKVSAAAPQAATQKANEQRAADAKRANQVNVKTTQGGRAKPMSEEEALSAAYDRAASAA